MAKKIVVRHAAQAFVAALSLTGCLADVGDQGAYEEGDDVALSSTDQPLYYDKDLTWKKRDVPVCWKAEAAGSVDVDVRKARVREALMGQRGWRHFGNINFTGWGDCSGDPVGIRIKPGSGAWTSIGSTKVDMELDFTADMASRWPRCTTNGLGASDCIQAVALHEFGHAIAYAHEQGRPENQHSEFCGSFQGGDWDNEWKGDSTFGEFDEESIMNYCALAEDASPIDRRGTERLYGSRLADTPKLADYNGDNRDDLFCFDVISGAEYIDYADSAHKFSGEPDFSDTTGWCNANSHRRLFNGYFNNDSKADLLCFDEASGDLFLDYASSTGTFGGTDWTRDGNWCNDTEDRRLFVGDFNKDERDDLLCFDTADGKVWIDYNDGNGKFGGTDWSAALDFCNFKETRRLFVGDYNGDKRDDLLCFDQEVGNLWIDYANTSGQFGAIDFTGDIHWCNNTAGRTLYTGDFNGDTREDLLCHDAATGSLYVDYASTNGQFAGTDWSRTANFCNANEDRLFIGDINKDNHDDLVCHQVQGGLKQVDYANDKGEFEGVNHSTTDSYCARDAGEIH